MTKRQHFKGKKRLRGWHRTNKEGKLWADALKVLDHAVKEAQDAKVADSKRTR